MSVLKMLKIKWLKCENEIKSKTICSYFISSADTVESTDPRSGRIRRTVLWGREVTQYYWNRDLLLGLKSFSIPHIVPFQQSYMENRKVITPSTNNNSLDIYSVQGNLIKILLFYRIFHRYHIRRGFVRKTRESVRGGSWTVILSRTLALKRNKWALTKDLLQIFWESTTSFLD